MDYWKECVSCALDEAGIIASNEQIETIKAIVEGAHDNIGQAYYAPENPLISENKKLERQLSIERDKRHCEECNGKGRITTQGTYHSSNSECYKCRGEGKL